MKKAIHPHCQEVAFTCSCGHVTKVLSVLNKAVVNIDVCGKCHPFYTGKQKLLDTGGRLHKFRERYSQ